jgi:hypothetical protein
LIETAQPASCSQKTTDGKGQRLAIVILNIEGMSIMIYYASERESSKTPESNGNHQHDVNKAVWPENARLYSASDSGTGAGSLAAECCGIGDAA